LTTVARATAFPSDRQRSNSVRISRTDLPFCKNILLAKVGIEHKKAERADKTAYNVIGPDAVIHLHIF
jgi:hypothetical protein